MIDTTKVPISLQCDGDGFRRALRLTGLDTSELTCEIFIMVYNKYQQVGDGYSIRDAAKIQADMKERHPGKSTHMIQTELW